MGASQPSSSSPAWSSDKPSSRAEHSIPFDSTPRSFACLISSPGSFAPTSAQGTRMPVVTFGAPQTICKIAPVPASTSHTRSLSAFGWGAIAFTSATTIWSNAAVTGAISSTSSPAIVNLCASSSTVNLVSTSSLSQFTETFILASC